MRSSGLLLSAGLALTIATQLRLAGWPVGLGEVLLVAWICISWVEIVGRKNIRIPADFRPFVFFFVAVVAMLLLSLGYQVVRTGDLFRNAFHDLVAYTFVGVLVLTFAFLRPSQDDSERSLKALAVGLALPLAVLLVISQVTSVIGPVRLDNGFRFFGPAENPNQLGMALVPIPFLCVLFMREAKTLLGRMGYASTLGLAFCVGVATDSDALWLAWVVGALLFATTVLLTKVAGRVHPALTIANLFGIGVLALVLLVVTPVGSGILERVAEGDGGGRRTLLWTDALSSVLESPIIGRGPGSQTLLANVQATGEAHNSYLDLALATGLIGLGAAIWLMATLVLRASLLARPLLWSAFMAMQCFVMFHYMFRHPLFWFYVILMASFAHRDYEARLRPRPRPASGQVKLRLGRA